MRNWLRIFIVCLVLVGTTALFGYLSFSQINKALDDLSAAHVAMSNVAVVIRPEHTREDVSTTTPEDVSTTTPDRSPALATSTEMKLSLVLPKSAGGLYSGCAYQISLQSSAVVDSLDIALIDGGTREASGPIASGLAKSYKLTPSSQKVDWKIGAVWPGEYFIQVQRVNGIEKKIQSAYFMIQKMPDGVTDSDRTRICRESGGA